LEGTFLRFGYSSSSAYGKPQAWFLGYFGKKVQEMRTKGDYVS
jgi:hypothetical protein